MRGAEANLSRAQREVGRAHPRSDHEGPQVRGAAGGRAGPCATGEIGRVHMRAKLELLQRKGKSNISHDAASLFLMTTK
jgi:hypothetical protein